MPKNKPKHNGIGYRHIDSITLDVHPPFLKHEEVSSAAKAQWVLTDIISMAEFLEAHVPGESQKTS
ncbi:hypothetical protein R3P38DRAFT_3227955 [Favolaschia claudopus]|uniref:Uncharacterized protein n=1 Tax=Favolaschia claudopus TaxID=2862362 RepID=A0AAV9ZSG4_9AGAR